MKKSKAVYNITEGRLGRQILFFSLPLIASNLLQVFFNMADVAIVGRFAGAMAMGAVGSTNTLILLFTGVLMGMGSGVNALTARYIGAKSEKDTRETVHTSLILFVLVGLIALVLGVVFSQPMLKLQGAKAELIDDAVLYLRIYFLGMPALAVYNYGYGVLSAAGDTKRPLYCMTLSGAINIVLNVFFVVVLHISVAGVAIASVISQYVSAGLVLRLLFCSREMCALRLRCLRITREKVRPILALGFPAGMQNAIFSAANLFIQGGLNTFDAITVAGSAAAANADGLIYDVMNAFYTACTTFMSQNYGAKKRERILKSYFICLAYSFGFAAVVGSLLAVFGTQFLSLFTTETEAITAGLTRLRVMGLSYAFSAFMDCSIAASRGLGKGLVPTVIVIVGVCVFRVVWIFTVFAYFHTVTVLYLLYIFSWTISGVAEVIYFAWCYKKQMALM